MKFILWNNEDYFRKPANNKKLASLVKQGWDSGIDYKPAVTPTEENNNITYTMPCFGQHGRWGNIIFQYLFIRILAANNNAAIELFRNKDWIHKRLNLYDDMASIPNVQTWCNTVLLDTYHLLPGGLAYIPRHFLRAAYISKVRQQNCYMLKNVYEVLNEPLSFEGETSVELEGLFIVNPKLYKLHKDFILKNLFLPCKDFVSIINTCLKKFDKYETVIGIHIRKGDFVTNPLGQAFQFPIPVKFIVNWLAANISSFSKPAILVCSDNEDAYKEIEKAGFEVFTVKKLIPKIATDFKYEQLEWELLRRCDVLVNSNSTFSFSSAMLSLKNPACYKFSLTENIFFRYDPWESEPLQIFTTPPNLWGYFYARFKMVANLVNKRSAYATLLKDIKKWMIWKSTKRECLYYVYGISPRFFIKLFNIFEFFKLNSKNESYSDYDQIDHLKL